MFLNDIDPQFIKSLNYLYSSDALVKGDTVPLQYYLEEAIKSKVGVSKDLSSVVATSFKQRRVTEFKPFINTLEESNGSSSDKELELDLLKEDLMCIVCNGMDVGARNRLLECSDCHMLYHQECHKPIVTNQDSFDSWVCQNCKDASKKMKLATTTAVSSPSSTHTKVSSSSSSSSSSSTSSSKSTSSHRHSSSGSYKSGADSKSEKYAKTTTSKTSSTSSKPATSSSSTSRTITPNINIISADKRIQIMKKKAAKLQEKRLTRVTR
ncbi:integrator complex subunit 12 [Tribolium castaneum]|uniref:Integrator complex subunit 12 n=1 Tax=Tribolium castaneum TaxID=7070 RepID=D7EJN8_TRICA|nr:PREDICTED: integrator complex subunit 12 [Tribolium castaneum]KYB29555.1 Integrator complex subunit 12-like protein [Tribolium castaneum]|eukprot:XP_969158.1 PREDICTED: integrator complex subunit 12 [Tribolium castaneum]